MNEDIQTSKEIRVEIGCLRELMAEKERFYLERINGQIGRIDGAMAAVEKATKVAEEAMQKWKDGSNEWRKSLEDARDYSMPRPEADSKFAQLSQRLDAHEKILNEGRGRQTGNASTWAMIISVATMLLTGIMILVMFSKK